MGSRVSETRQDREGVRGKEETSHSQGSWVGMGMVQRQKVREREQEIA